MNKVIDGLMGTLDDLQDEIAANIDAAIDVVADIRYELNQLRKEND